MEDRRLTDADVDAIVCKLQEKVVKTFYQDLGRSVWSFVWRIIVVGIIGAAGYGAVKNS